MVNLNHEHCKIWQYSCITMAYASIEKDRTLSITVPKRTATPKQDKCRTVLVGVPKCVLFSINRSKRPAKHFRAIVAIRKVKNVQA